MFSHRGWVPEPQVQTMEIHTLEEYMNKKKLKSDVMYRAAMVESIRILLHEYFSNSTFRTHLQRIVDSINDVEVVALSASLSLSLSLLMSFSLIQLTIFIILVF